MKNDFHTYPLHNEDKSVVRRAYNRFVTARNIYENHGRVMCERYMQQFDDKGRGELATIMFMAKKEGIEAVNLHVVQHCNKLGV